MPACLDIDTNVVDCGDPTCYTGPCAPGGGGGNSPIYSAVSGQPVGNNPGLALATSPINNGGSALSFLSSVFNTGEQAYAASQQPASRVAPRTQIQTPLGAFSGASLTALVPVALLVLLAFVAFGRKKPTS